jgi:hypothetical protein
MPQFEHQQAPDTAKVIAAFREVFVQQAPYSLWVEIPALQSTGIEQYREYQIFQLMANPMDERQRKALLPSIENLSRHSDAFR